MSRGGRSRAPSAAGAAERLRGARRVVIKIGSALLVDPIGGELNRAWLAALIEDVVRLIERGTEVLLVSSGAIALGRRYLKLQRRDLRLEQSQAAAAAGQILLAHAYQEALAAHGLPVAQILVTIGDTEERERYLNARSTVNTLLGMGVVPVVNENDTVATSEIRYGDNDRLAGRVAQMISADCLVLLSDVDGLYRADPIIHPDAEPVPVVEEFTPEIEAMAGDARSGLGKGGMVTKLAAARIAVAAGCDVLIASGRRDHPLAAIEQGARATWFVAHETPRAARKQWIGGSLKPRGALVVDEGAERALGSGNSLLPRGVVQVEGDFERGAAVTVSAGGGRIIGHGLCAYSSAEARLILGRHSSEIEAVLGYRGGEELIHRDDLVLL